MPRKINAVSAFGTHLTHERILRRFIEDNHLSYQGLQTEVGEVDGSKTWLTKILHEGLEPPLVSVRTSPWLHRITANEKARHETVLRLWQDWVRAELADSGRFLRYTHAPVEIVYDLIGLGALNYDAVAPTSKYPGDKAPDGEGMEEGRDVIQTDLDAQNELYETKGGHWRFGWRHGGSAFNTSALLAEANLGLRLGFLGMSEAPHEDWPIEQTHHDFLTRRGVDHLRLQDPCAEVDITEVSSGEYGGWCLTYPTTLHDNTVRFMSTWPGANAELGLCIYKNFWELLQLLRSASWIHLSSVYDLHTAEAVADLITALTRTNSDTKISFDPGTKWAEGGQFHEACSKILDCANLVFATRDEIQLLADAYGNDPVGPPDNLPSSVLRRMSPRGALIVLKQRGWTQIYRIGESEPTEVRGKGLQPNEDDTGAGDAFAAGYLAGVLADCKAEYGADLGMRLAALKIKSGVGTNHPTIARRLHVRIRGRKYPGPPSG